MDEHTLDIRTKQLVDFFNIGNEPVDVVLGKITDYLQKYSDQRKKPSEIHGLDKWAQDVLDLQQKEYSDAERKILRKYFQGAEKDILEKAKSLLVSMIDGNRTVAIEEFLRQPFRDELKAHICQIIADRNLPDYKDSLINLYLKGTQKSSQAAFDCMRRLKDLSFYYPMKQLRPNRYKISNDDLNNTLNDFKQAHLEIQLTEGAFQVGNLTKIDSTVNISKLCEVLIGLDYDEQGLVCKNLRNNLGDSFEKIGKQLEKNYSAIGQITTKDYSSSLKRAIGDSLMIGGWKIAGGTESLIARNLASQKDIEYLERIFGTLDIKYRRKFLKSVLNPPKHIKDENSKKRLIWIYNQLKGKFKNDFGNFEKFIKWHVGNDDVDIKIETMLLLASLSREPEEDTIKGLKEFSQDDRYQKYHDRINAILPDDSLRLESEELEGLSNTALESKLSSILIKDSAPALKKATEALCGYLENIDGVRFQFVFKQVLSLIQKKPEKADNSSVDCFFETLVEILEKEAKKEKSFLKDYILTNNYFLESFCDRYPDSSEKLSEGVIAKIVKNCISIHPDANKSIGLALQLSSRGDKHRKFIWTEWADQVVSNKENLSQIIEQLTVDQKIQMFTNILIHISHLKNEVKKNEDRLIEVNESMQQHIVSEILPQLNRAKQRAGDQPLLTENYDKILGILSDYVKKETDGKNEKTESNQCDESLFGVDVTTSLIDLVNKVSSLSMTQRDHIVQTFVEGRYNNNKFDELLQEASDIPKLKLEWFTYRLIDFVLDQLPYADRLLKLFQDEKVLWNTTNKMLFRLHSEHQLALKQIRSSRDNKLKEIGRLIGEYLEKIEINLFGYYEMSESLAKMGLVRIFNKPGEIVSKDKLDLRRHKVLPSQKETGQYQVITLGLKLPSDETIREAFLESKN